MRTRDVAQARSRAYDTTMIYFSLSISSLQPTENITDSLLQSFILAVSPFNLYRGIFETVSRVLHHASSSLWQF